MGIRTSQPPHLRKPLAAFGIGFLIYSAVVASAFFITSRWLPQTGDWQSFLSALPGIALCGIFVLLYLYIRHNDELVRRITTTSLAVTCVVGISTHVVSMTRAAIGGYAEFAGGIVVAVMAITFIVVSSILSWKHR